MVDLLTKAITLVTSWEKFYKKAGLVDASKMVGEIPSKNVEAEETDSWARCCPESHCELESKWKRGVNWKMPEHCGYCGKDRCVLPGTNA